MIVKNVSKRGIHLPDESGKYHVFTPGDNEISKENLESVIKQNKQGWDAHYCKPLVPVKSFTEDVEETSEPDDEISLILKGSVSSIKDFADSCEDIDLLTRLADAEDEKEKSRTSAIGMLAARIAELKDQGNPVDSSEGVEGDED